MGWDIENLRKMDVKDLKTLAMQQGHVVRGNPKADTLIKRILEGAAQQPAPKDALKHVAEMPSEAKLVMNTEEQVREVCKKSFETEGFTAKFDGETWTFACKGAEECGHMSVPLRVIKMKAENIARGAVGIGYLGRNANGDLVMRA